MTHLGTQVSALADGQLSPAAAERALAHVAVCPECEAELRAARAAHRALRAAMDVPAADPDLTARLLAIGCPPPGGAARPAAEPFSLDGSVPLPGTRERVPADCLDGTLGRGRSVSSRALVLTGAGLGVVVAALVSLGDEPLVVPSGHPAQAMSVLGAVPTAAPAGTTAELGDDELPLDDDDGDALLAWMSDEGWACPTDLPDGLEVTALRLHADGALEIDLVGEDATLVVTERRGRLHAPGLEGATPVELGGRTVHVLSSAPWHGVWQSGDTVVGVVAQGEADAVEELVAAYPDDPYDDGLPARLSRGWAELAGSWSP
ncbi:zf-HC2 domain-containing protein [Cellulomonas sp. APG4]|uniref:zf-HC2 domain-containing protein n=1 Tax=Cellulomonas sp. APG4 TaxID=1538656 RepID=UPI00137A9E70|nr:zf-HC2 domain-containing protein [Cellulomonas sp. APG4]